MSNYQSYYRNLQNKQSGEEVKEIIRKSIIAYVLSTFSDVFLILIGGMTIYLLWCRIIYGDLKFHLMGFIILCVYGIIICGIWFFFWYHTYLLITNHRIEKHKPTYLLGDHKEILWYHEISKISFSYPNLPSKLLHYGTIEIIAGDTEKNNITFNQAPYPEKIVEKLRNLKKDSI